jgi:hypothetical protein
MSLLQESHDRNYRTFVHSRVKWLGTDQADFMHAAAGLVGEAIEYSNRIDTANELEELGDLEFYLQHALIVTKAFDRPRPNSVNYFPPAGFTDQVLITVCGDVLDFAKKIWIYNKPAAELPLLQALSGVRQILLRIYESKGISSNAVRDANIAKLIKRYPTGYSDQAAQARADKGTK